MFLVFFLIFPLFELILSCIVLELGMFLSVKVLKLLYWSVAPSLNVLVVTMFTD